MRFLVAAWVIGAALFYPHALQVSLEKGYDFPVYYAAAFGDYYSGIGEHPRSPWVYSERLMPLLKPLKGLGYEVGFAIMYVANALALLGLWGALGYARRRYPILGWSATVGAGIVWFVVLRLGNVLGVLAFACATPVGAVLAACVKPYLVSFVLLHAAAICYGISLQQPVSLRVAAKHCLLGYGLGSGRKHQEALDGEQREVGLAA